MENEYKSKSLRAGPLELDYQNGFLRYLRFGSVEVLRMVNFAVRDQNWGTIPFRIKDEQVKANTDSFNISYQAIFESPPCSFVFSCKLQGSPSGEITFTIEGQAQSDSLANRAGFTVLHPLRECTGQSLHVTHSDGSREDTVFPELISPHQPAFDIAALTWSLPEGRQAKIEFTGDTFEMEDQRNWTDASYKTYCTPLAKPFPVQIKTGDRVQQSIRLTVTNLLGEIRSISPKAITLTAIKQSIPFPKIGVCRSTQTNSLSFTQIEKLKALHLSHYRIDLDCGHANWSEQWTLAAQESKKTALPIELALHLPNKGPNPDELATLLFSAQAPIAQITLYQTECNATSNEVLTTFIPPLRQLFPKAKIGSGTDAFFAELNRERPADTTHLDYLAYSINPQVHAYDEQSIIETLEAQAATVRTAQSFAQGAEIHVSPITLKMRWNPNATGTPTELPPQQLPADADRRQASPFAAAWTLGTIKQLAEAGATSLTLYEAVGEKGLMHNECPLFPDRFPAAPGSLFPIYHLLHKLSNAVTMTPIQSSSPLLVDALWIQNGSSSDTLLVANYSRDEQQVQLPEQFGSTTLKIAPFEIAIHYLSHDE